MRKLKYKWLIWYSKLLSAMIALLGITSCSPSRAWNMLFADSDLISTNDSISEESIRVVYGPIYNPNVKPVVEDAEEGDIFEVAEVMPRFPGGEEKLKQYLQENLQYPPKAIARNLEARVLVQFVVGVDGSLSDVEVKRPVDPFLDQEAVRVVSSMPNWEPGMIHGVKVRIRYCLPVTFRAK